MHPHVFPALGAGDMSFVIDQSNYNEFWFYDTQLKTSLIKSLAADESQ